MPSVLDGRAFNELGAAGRYVETTASAGYAKAPLKVPLFWIKQDEGNSSILHLRWGFTGERDIAGYRLFDGANKQIEDLICGNSYKYFISNSGTYTFKIKSVNRSGALSAEFAEASIEAKVAAGSVAVPDAPNDGEITMIKGELFATWSAVTNTYIDYYEVRTNDAVGQKAGLLAKTADIRSAVSLSERSGAILVYGHNPQKGYGKPLSVHYDFPAPTIEVTNTLQGFNISIKNKPEHVSGTRVHISGSGISKTIETTGAFVSYSGVAGIYAVQAAFYDAFGEGVLSLGYMVTVAANIDKAAIKGLTITQQDLDAVLAEKLRRLDMSTKRRIASRRLSQNSRALRKHQATAPSRRSITDCSSRSIRAMLCLQSTSLLGACASMAVCCTSQAIRNSTATLSPITCCRQVL